MKKYYFMIVVLLVAVVQGTSAWDGSGTESNPYLLNNEEDWNTLAEDVANGESYRGAYFKMTNNLTPATVIGSYNDDCAFSGHFDGNSKMLIINDINIKDEIYTAPFRYICDATIGNLRVVGSLFCGDFGSCLIGRTEGTNTIQGIRIDGGVISRGNHVGGIIGHAGNARNAILGCISCAGVNSAIFMNGVLQPVMFTGGLVGWSDNSTLTVNECLVNCNLGRNQQHFNPIGFRGESSTVTIEAINHCFTYGPIATDTLVKNFISNNYQEVCRINLAEGLVIGFDDDAVTKYDNALSFSSSAAILGNICYVVNGQRIGVTLSAAAGYVADNFVVSNGELAKTETGYVLDNLTCDVTISADVKATEMEGNGTEENPFIIVTRQQMEQLAADVNNGKTFENQFFKLGADINYVPTSNNHASIGRYYKKGNDWVKMPFCGHFDADGHVISNMRVDPSNNGQGTFGYVGKGGVVKNLIVSMPNFKGISNIGGIVGFNEGTIENCHVLNGYVSCSEEKGGMVGGIAGQNFGSIVNCSNTAQVYARYAHAGGITGINTQGSSMSNCLFLGSVVTAANLAGAITGFSNAKASCSNNYYTAATIGGIMGKDVYENDAAVPAQFEGEYICKAVGLINVRATFLADHGITTESDLWPEGNAKFQFQNHDDAQTNSFGFDNTSGVEEETVKTIGPATEGWYTMSGRKLDNKPAERGMYIYNGKKVFVQ